MSGVKFKAEEKKTNGQPACPSFLSAIKLDTVSSKWEDTVGFLPDRECYSAHKTNLVIFAELANGKKATVL